MLLQNFSSGSLASSMNSSQTTLTVTPGNNLPTGTGIFTAIIWNSAAYASPSMDPNAEIVWCQYSTLNNYTITRAMEGTVAVAHAAGALVGLYITAGVLSLPYVKVSETQSSGTSGQTPNTTGSWVTCILNTKDSDTANISSLGSNQLTLPAGTYQIRASVPGFAIDSFTTRLYNITGSAVLINGTSEDAPSNADNATQSRSYIVGQFILSITSNVAIQIQMERGGTVGESAGYGTEVYTIAEFTLVNT